VRFSKFIQDYNPHIVTTYNGDRFDYPYILRRMELNFMKFTAELGISDQSGEFYGSHIAHLDCFCWV
jgi:DNA polymerase epsilon subunit 1